MTTQTTKPKTGTVQKSVRPQPKGGSRKGIPNKVTTEARQAIAAFVDGNAHRLTGWLDQVADGIPKEGEDGFWLVPNPAKAFELFQSVVEYHIPKLARQEHVGEGGGPLVVNLIRFSDSNQSAK